MKPQAVEQARRRLERAELADEALDDAKTLAEIESAWTDFLLASASIYNKLQQGARGCSKSEAWFGRKKHDRKTDPLLSYIHHARNSDEHGIDPITERHEGGITVTAGGMKTFFPGATHVGGLQPGIAPLPVGAVVERVRFDFDVPRVKLVTVTDTRYGDSFDPPTSHRGKPMTPSPHQISRFGLNYLMQMIDEAAELAGLTKIY